MQAPKRLKTLKLRDLFSFGIPSLTFGYNGKNSSKHTSDHAPIEQEFTENTFEILDDIAARCESEDLDDVQCSLFKKSDAPHVNYSSESELQSMIYNLLTDLLNITGLDKTLEFTMETVVPQWKYLGSNKSNKSDFWLITVGNGRPIAVVEVKSPHNLNVLSDANVVGQIADYMLDVQSFYGHRDVVGITTTVEKFKLHWFRHSRDCAAAKVSVDRSGEVLDESLEMEREVCSSRIYKHDDPQLIPLLASVLFKCRDSPHYKVKLIDPHRMYVRVKPDGWWWSKLPTSAVNLEKLTVRMGKRVKQSNDYTVVKYFVRYKGNEHHDVFLALAGTTSCLVVIKLFDIKALAEQERLLWTEVNRCEHVFIKELRTRIALCVPFVIHATLTDEEEGRSKVHFEFDLSVWSTQAGATAGDLPLALQRLTERLKVVGAAWTDAREVARQAVEKMAATCWVHDDMEWRHFALLPVFGAGEELEGLEPVMIDFSNARQVDSVEEARQTMTVTLDELIADVVWE